MSREAPDGAAVALSLQRALLGAVTPALRACGFTLDKSSLAVTFVFDGAPTEDDIEAIQMATTELISDFPEELYLQEQVMRVDSPAPVPQSKLGRLVFLRREA